MSLKHFVRQHVPWGLVRRMRRVYYLPRDTMDLVLGRRDALTPPLVLRRFVGEGLWQETGENFLRFFIEYCDLARDASFLDVGCGIGRIAVPLTRHIGPDGRYEGFDIVPEAIRWCQKSITSRFPNFRFHFADIYNGQYNPSGKLSATEYRFPSEDGRFDFVFAGSLFTHLLARDTEHYFAETARVMKPGGRAFATVFILNDESRRLMKSDGATYDFTVALDGCMSIDAKTPERAVGYDEAYLTELCARNGLSVVPPIRYGSWPGCEAAIVSDILIVEKG